LFDRLDRGVINIMPAITEIGQIWTPAGSFLVDISTDPYREARGEELMFATDADIQEGLDRLVGQIHDAIQTLS
ncbi:MAG: sugar ABC transporter substrate-binding protein, partial [Oscillospiraceae bacterium]|nr:sugar ABC transporter substrate-binding protein [Oscillospiraceae bacterium]